MLRNLTVLVLTMASAGVGADAPRQPKFSDYPIDIMSAPRAPLRLDRDDLDFRTRLRALYKSKPNFAGHFAVAEVGCGTFCAFLLVIDLKTGRTVWLRVPMGEDLYVCDDDYIDENGSLAGEQGAKFHYRPNSRLFFVTGKMPKNECGIRYFVETNGRMVQIKDVRLQARQ